MILADKICMLRKKNGWSQEELAGKMNVTRQAISKWEGAQAIPDVEKILLMSRVFGVTTDYLMKDEVEAEEFIEVPEEMTTVRKVSMEEANEFLRIKRQTAKSVAGATFLCIISPVFLMILSAMADTGRSRMTVNAAAGLGLSVLLITIAVAVAIFIASRMKTYRYDYLEEEAIDTAYGVTGMVRERMKQYEGTYARSMIIGTMLCILGALPLFLGMALSENEFFMVLMVCLLLWFVALGCVFFITAGINHASMQKLLQEGDYTKRNKKGSRMAKTIGSVYWLIITSIYLAYSFATGDWGRTWIIWPVAGVLHAAVNAACQAFGGYRYED